MNIKTRAKIVAGSSEGIVMRVQSDEQIELGDLLVVETPRGYAIMKVYQLAFGSQVPGGIREMLVGMKLEGYGEHLEFLEPELRNYTMAEALPLLLVSQEGEITKPKSLPKMFSNVRRIEKEDLDFLTEPVDGIYVGKIRSGSKILNLDVFLKGEEVLSHHILIPAITGRGKSNLVKVMLWSIMDNQRFGTLVLDPHDEYYGRHHLGMKDHPAADANLLYYSTNPPTGASTLIINIRTIHPMDFQGIVQFTHAQEDAIRIYYQRHGKEWIEHIVRGTIVENVQPVTLSVLQRKMETILGIYADEDNEIVSRNRAFSAISGETTVSSIVDALEDGKKVILDTSIMSDEAELLLGSIIGRAILYRHTSARARGELEEVPVVSVVIEEAPRVLGGKVLHSRGPNIYSRVAREGRKFKMGLVAITQLTSVIPRTILTNMNTKIVLGNEMVTERNAIIDSAAQDLSRDDRLIASLDKGQAIVTSSFTKFAVPIQTPLFEDYAVPVEKSKTETTFEGVDIE